MISSHYPTLIFEKVDNPFNWRLYRATDLQQPDGTRAPWDGGQVKICITLSLLQQQFKEHAPFSVGSVLYDADTSVAYFLLAYYPAELVFLASALRLPPFILTF